MRLPSLRQITTVIPAIMLTTFLAAPMAWAGKLLDELQVADTCGMGYADKLASCTPFRCQKPNPFFAYHSPTAAEMSKLTAAQKREVEFYQANVEKKLQAMTSAQRVEMSEKMTSTIEIIGVDAQGRCHTRSISGPTTRMDCALDAATLQKVSDLVKIEERSKSVRLDMDSSSGNPWQDALQSGVCMTLTKDSDAGWVSLDQMNRMAHIELHIAEHGKPVAARVRVINTADGAAVFDKEVKTDRRMLEINIKPGVYDIEINSIKPDLAAVWFRNLHFDEAGLFRKNVDFYTIDFGQIPDGTSATDKAISEPAPETKKSQAADTNGMERDTDRPGGADLRDLVIADADPAVCQKACRDDAKCQAWTYVKPNTV